MGLIPGLVKLHGETICLDVLQMTEYILLLAC